jgi:hypothetical protein
LGVSCGSCKSNQQLHVVNDAETIQVVATSYDYSSPISEDRSLWSKYCETKLLGFFTRAAKDLTKTNRLRNTTSLTTNPKILTTELRNPDTNAAFYVTIHANSSSGSLETFKLHVKTSEGLFTIPQYEQAIALNGHQSKIIVTDFSFGDGHLVYSTAEVLSYTTFDEKSILYLWVPDGESVEFYLKNAVHGEHVNDRGCHQPRIRQSDDGKDTIVSFARAEGMAVFEFKSKSSKKAIEVVVMDRTTAYTVWFPELSTHPTPSSDELVFVQGPYLVRRVVSEGRTLEVYGDNINATSIEIMAPSKFKSVKWNGRKLQTSKTSYGSLTAHLKSADDGSVSLPPLSGWKSADSLPEISRDYDTFGLGWVGE